MRAGKGAVWAGGGGVLAIVALPLLLLAGIGGSTSSMGLCPPGSPEKFAESAHAAGADTAAPAGLHIDLPLAEADAAPPVPPELIAPGPWSYPVPAPATVTVRFGQSGPHWSTRHTGTDFAAPAGTAVFAASDGVVLAVVHESAGRPFGTFVTLLHADNTVTVYAHLQEAAVARGQELAVGQQIGTVGSTGNSTGPHLHFEVRPQIKGRHLPVDPEPFLATATLSAAGTGPTSAQASGCLWPAGAPSGPVDTAALPELARAMTPTIVRLLEDCPELPLEWVHAQVMAESSWNPGAWTSDSNGGAAGLYQLSHEAWAAAEGDAGTWTRGSRPPASHPVWEPAVHLRVAITHACGNLREMTAHLLRHPTKPISPLEAMAVCHVAGCSRVMGSVSGIPVPGEAMCGRECVATVHAYLANISRHLHTITGTAPDTP